MAAYYVSGLGSTGIGGVAGLGLRPDGGQPQRVKTPLAAVSARQDGVAINADSLALYRLTTMWGALSSLFGYGSDRQQPAAPDLSGLREAIAQARQSAQDAQMRQRVSDSLKTSVLAGAERLIGEYYGLTGDGTGIKVDFAKDPDGALAQVTFAYDRSGKIIDPHLRLNVAQFVPDTSANGTNSHIIQNDRIVAHELTHLVMGRNLDLAALPDWFAEGTGEYIAGGAERVALSLRAHTPRQLLSHLLQPWQGTSDDYAAGYLAVRFLDQATAEAGGLKAIMARLKAGDGLDQAIAAVSQGRYNGAADFFQRLVTDGSGVSFVRSIDLSGRDEGSIKPGPGAQVVADTGTRTDQPLLGFRLTWPSPLEGMNLNLPQLSWGFGATTPQVASQAYLRQNQ